MAVLFSKSRNKEHLLRLRFHLYNVDGLVKWTSDYNDKNSNCKESVEEKIRNADGFDRDFLVSNVPSEEVHWSVVIRMKGMIDFELKISAVRPSFTRSKIEMLVLETRRCSRLLVYKHNLQTAVLFLRYRWRN